MAITQAMPTSFKIEILTAYHNFGTTVTRGSTSADTFKIALYTSSASLGSGTTAYSTSNEVTGTGYTAGGNTLFISTVPTNGGSGTTAYLSFSDTQWTTATFSTDGALIYNSSQGNRAVAVLSFGSTKTVSTGTLLLQFPTADATNAIIRII